MRRSPERTFAGIAVNDLLHRLIRQEQYRQHDAKRWPTSSERIPRKSDFIIPPSTLQIKRHLPN